MKLTDKRFWILLIVIVSAAVAFAQTVFSVEEVSRTEYANAEKDYSRYNVIPADTIADNEIVSLILKESQTKFERLDTDIQQNIYYLIDAEEFGFNKQQLLYLPELKLYGFIIPDRLHDDSVWWFDADSGRYICNAACPTAINANGIYVSQTGYDCDWPLDLRFFRRGENVFYEFESYKSTQFNGETVVYQEEDDELPKIFWHNNNILYLKTLNHEKRQEVYLKIRVKSL